jgi:hypothetical protein
MSGSSGDLEQAVDAYWRSATQLWFLPLKVWEALKGVTTLQSTQFKIHPVDLSHRHLLSLSKSLAPGIPYARRSEALSDTAIRFDSAVLEPGADTFRLLVQADTFHLRPGATYWGEVTVTDDANNQVVERVDVWLVVS